MKKENFDFEEYKKYREDMMLTFHVQGLLNHDDNSIVNGLPEKDKKRIFEIYGDINDKASLSKNFNKEVERLDQIERKTIYDYVSHIIEKRKNITEITPEVLNEMKKDHLTANHNYLNGYEISFINLCFAKNQEDYDKIKDTLQLDKQFLYFNHLMFAMLNDENMMKHLKDERKVITELYFNQENPVKSMSEFYEILKSNNHKFHDEKFVDFAEQLLKAKDPSLLFNPEIDLRMNNSRDAYHISGVFSDLYYEVNQVLKQKSHEVRNERELKNLERLCKIIDHSVSPLTDPDAPSYFDRLSIDQINATHNVREREIDKAREKIENIRSALKRGF